MSNEEWSVVFILGVIVIVTVYFITITGWFMDPRRADLSDRDLYPDCEYPLDGEEYES